MRRLCSAAAMAALVLLLAAPVSAHPTVPLQSAAPTDLSYRATDNVEYLGRFPEHSGTAGGALSPDGTKFYLTDPRGVSVYDVSSPASPALLGSIPLFQTTTGAALAQEDPNSNGEILLVDAATTPAGPAELQVVDVSNPRNLRVLDTVNVTDHTWTCVAGIDASDAVNSCAFAYGRTGHIVDLTDPTDARLLPTTWRAAVGYGDGGNTPYTHDLTEIRRGLVMYAGSTAILMDTSDPANPVRLTAIDQPGRFTSLGYHSVEWGRGGRDRYLVAGTEIAPDGATNLAGSDCVGENSVIETWDASKVIEGLDAYARGASAGEAFAGRTFEKVDAYDAGGRGLFLDGQAPGHLLYCAHWMELHPSFKRGGRMAVSYYDRGTRFVDIARDGTMSEVGWITPVDGYSGSPQWVSDDIVYVMDYRRGLEIVRLIDRPATRVKHHKDDRVAAASVFATPHSEGVGRVIYLLTGVVGMMMLHLDIRRRRAAR
ncbi:MAG: hypothetical protein GEU74_00375 [Nitriliruptorales bacterium]|nr:hypothetical protein [Nitriliruptorales bacterium]